MQVKLENETRQPAMILLRSRGPVEPLGQGDRIQDSDATSSQDYPRKPFFWPPLVDIGSGNGHWVDKCPSLGISCRIKVRAVNQETFQTDDDPHDPDCDEN